MKRLLVLCGAALLAAGCSSDATSPIRSVTGASAAARDAKATTKGANGIGAKTAMQASDSTSSCFSVWPINSGIVADTSCAGEP